MPRVNNSFDIDRIYSQRFRDLEIKPFKDRLERTEANKTQSAEKGSALQALQELTAKMQNAIASFTATGRNSLFNMRKATVLTRNDVGNGSDYMNVSVDSTVPKGEINLKIDRVAIASSVTIGLDGAGNGFPHPPALNSDLGNFIATLNGGDQFDASNPPLSLPKILITAAGVTHEVAIANGTDTIYDIKNYINTQLSGNNLRADVISNANGDFLAISSTVTGVNNLQVQFQNHLTIIGPPAPHIVPANIQNTTVGADAQVTIKGVQITNSSNTIKDILPGVTVELKKPNNPDQGGIIKDLTIEVTSVVEPITNAFVNLVEVYNEFTEFSEAQTRTTKVGGIPKAADDAFLYNSAVLKDVTNKIKAVIGAAPGLTGNMISLADIGIGIPQPIIQGGKKGTKLEILDPVKLRDSILYRLDDIQKLFQNNANIVKAPGTTASLDLIRSSQIPAQALGAPFTINEDAGGNITFTLQGAGAVAANLNGNVLSFPGTVLDGLSFIYANRVPGTAQDFTVNLSQGVGDRFASQSNDLNSKILSEGVASSRKQARLEKLQQDAQTAFNKKEKEINDRVANLEMMALQFENQMNNLDDMMATIFE